MALPAARAVRYIFCPTLPDANASQKDAASIPNAKRTVKESHHKVDGTTAHTLAVFILTQVCS